MKINNYSCDKPSEKSAECLYRNFEYFLYNLILIYFSGYLTLFLYALVIILVVMLIIKKIKNHPKFMATKLLLIYILTSDIIVSIIVELIVEHNFALMLL